MPDPMSPAPGPTPPPRADDGAAAVGEVRRPSRIGSTVRLVVGGAIVLAVVVAALLAPFVAPMDPTVQDVRLRFTAPGETVDGVRYVLGTDELGRDVLSRIVYGSRISLLVGVGAVALQCVVGVTLGLLAGYYRRLDSAIMRVVDVQLAVPFLVLALAIIAVLGPSLRNLIIVLALSGWVDYARIVRGETLSLRSREYVEAARVIGVGGPKIIVRHILPNVLGTVIVIATLEVPRMIISEAALSFLGLGVQPPTPTWGGMVAGARSYLSVAWWVATFPGLAIMVTVLGMNLLGDWVRDRFDAARR